MFKESLEYQQKYNPNPFFLIWGIALCFWGYLRYYILGSYIISDSSLFSGWFLIGFYVYKKWVV